MIDVAEYTRFLEIEARLHGRPINAPSLGGVRYSVATGTAVYGHPLGKYDYFLHPRFGVVCALDDGGRLIDKTPVCEALDKELFDL